MTTALPGSPPPKLSEAWASLTDAAREALLPHLTGGTSAEYVADWMGRYGVPVGPTTVKLYIRHLKQLGEFSP